MIWVWNRINSSVMTEENISVQKENNEAYLNPYTVSHELPQGPHHGCLHSQKTVRITECPQGALCLSTPRQGGPNTSTMGASCCFHSILNTLPAFQYLFFVSVSHTGFFSASFYRVVLLVTRKNLSEF